MYISRLQLQSFRNFKQLKLSFQPGINMFFGPNATGKTTLLESIYVLGHGRSFKASLLTDLICLQETEFTVFSEVNLQDASVHRIGLSKAEGKPVKANINREKTRSLAGLAQVMPLLLISPESFKLLTSGSSERRQFLDWGVFHVEHAFGTVWAQYQKVLKQRNAALKVRAISEAQAWDEQLIALGESVAKYRQAFWAKFLPVATEHVRAFLPDCAVDLSLDQGWDKEASLAEALSGSLSADLKRGYTNVGPHRADLIATEQGVLATRILSRGQQKLLISGLFLAAGEFLYQETKRQCIYLIDDLGAELDLSNQERVLRKIKQHAQQVFVTGVSEATRNLLETALDATVFNMPELHQTAIL